MQIKNQKDFWAGLMFMGFGFAAMLIALGPPAFMKTMFKLEYGYQMGTAVRMGPAYFPTVLGGILAVLGIVIFVRSFASKLPREQTDVKMAFNALDFVIFIVIFATFAQVSKVLFKNADWGMLAASVLLSALAFKFRPKAKPLVLIIASCLVFAYLLKPLGLVGASMLLIFVAALGGHEYRFKEVAILAVVLSIFSIGVFVYGLTLPFPIWPAFVN